MYICRKEKGVSQKTTNVFSPGSDHFSLNFFFHILLKTNNDSGSGIQKRLVLSTGIKLFATFFLRPSDVVDHLIQEIRNAFKIILTDVSFKPPPSQV